MTLRRLALALFALGLVLAGCSGDDTQEDTQEEVDDALSDLDDQLSDDLSEGSEDLSDQSDALGSDLPINQLEIGACVEDEATLNSADVAPLDCDEPHVFELFATFGVEGDEYPGADQLVAEGEDRCQGDLFEEYVGVPYEESETYASPVPPSEETWVQASDRTVLCFAHTVDLTPTTGSVEGANS